MTPSLIHCIGAEITKLRRSLSWTVVVGLPLVMVVTGSSVSATQDEPLADGWHTLWLRSVVFHGLLPLTIGMAILGSLVWRPEHRGGNWNALMSTPVPSRQIVWAKTLAIAILGAVMQLIMLLTVIITGKLLFALPGMLPGRYFAVTALLMVAVLAVAAAQSGLSMAIRSFSVPIAIALIGAGTAAVMLITEIPGVLFVLPYALTARTAQMATGTFGDSGQLAIGTIAAVIASTAILTVVSTAVATRHLERRDVHA